MAVRLVQIDNTNRTGVLALRVAPEQDRFVGTVDDAIVRLPIR